MENIVTEVRSQYFKQKQRSVWTKVRMLSIGLDD